MNIVIPDALPRLHVGSHDVGTGRACIMNAIAYMNGDKNISDMPGCVYPPFASMMQKVNDSICAHAVCELCASAKALGLPHACVRPLCGPCAHDVWMGGIMLIGTAELTHGMGYMARRQAAAEIGSALIDWDAEAHHLQRAVECRNDDLVDIHAWAQHLRQVQDFLAGRQDAIPRLSVIRANGIEGAGGRSLVLMGKLLTAPADAFRHQHLASIVGQFYLRSSMPGMYAGSSEASSVGVRALLAKLPELVAVLRRHAGLSAQADIVVTAEQIARVPVAIG